MSDTPQSETDNDRRPGIQHLVAKLRAANPHLSERVALLRAKVLWTSREIKYVDSNRRWAFKPNPDYLGGQATAEPGRQPFHHHPGASMNATASIVSNLPTPGTLLPAQGGYFHGIVLINGALYGEVTGPKAECEVTDLVWSPDHTDVSGAVSGFDSLANTRAMADAGSPLAQAAVACRVGGFDDWAVPAQGSLLMQWDMRAALPKAQAFAKNWYWSSTQYSRDFAFGQNFANGTTSNFSESWAGGRARFVRRFPIESLID
ncbi:MAG: hypothetical protein KIS62_01405 [Ramlibacter sp.]|nr:hypothetical protein [Ramlibacter sp.]